MQHMAALTLLHVIFPTLGIRHHHLPTGLYNKAATYFRLVQYNDFKFNFERACFR